MGKLPARLRPAGFCFGFAALLVFNLLDIQAQMSGGTAGFCFVATAPPPGLWFPQDILRLEPTAICTFGQSMVQSGEWALNCRSKGLTTAERPIDGFKSQQAFAHLYKRQLYG